jgi:mono/diheme cytochrome c family protein
MLSLAAVPTLFATACGNEGIQLAENDPYHPAAVLFQQRCSGCHTLDAAGTEGSASKANSRERKDGPNFNVRAEDYGSVIYALANGGFASGPMPQNLVVGEEAKQVACFVAKYSGRSAKPKTGAANADQTSPQPGAKPPVGQTGQTGLQVPGADTCPK